MISGCGGSDNSNNIHPDGVKSLTISVDNSSIPVGIDAHMKAIIEYDDGTSSDSTSQVTWRSLNDDIAQANGANITGISNGVVEIEGTIGRQKASLNITVTSAVLTAFEVKLKSNLINDPDTLPIGLSKRLGAYATYSDDNVYDVSSHRHTYWESNFETIAYIDITGLVTGENLGHAQLKGAYLGYSATYDLTVTSALLTDIRVEPESVILAPNNEQQFSAIGTFTDNSEHDVSHHLDIEWSVTNINKSTISPTGLLRAQKGSYRKPATTSAVTSIGNISAEQTVYLPVASVLPLDGDFIGTPTIEEADVFNASYQYALIEHSPTGPSDVTFAVFDFYEAQSYCDNLIYNGFDDWALPTQAELNSLFNYYDGIPDVDGDYRIFKSYDWAIYWEFWTTTSLVEGTHSLVSLSQGFTNPTVNDTGPFSKGYATCVRNRP